MLKFLSIALPRKLPRHRTSLLNLPIRSTEATHWNRHCEGDLRLLQVSNSKIRSRYGRPKSCATPTLGQCRRRCDRCCYRQCYGLSTGHVSVYLHLQPESSLTTAFSRVKTKLQVQIKKKHDDEELHPGHVHYESTLHAIEHIMADEGLSGLYSGMSGALIGVASTNFAYFYWYSVVRTLYVSYQKVPTAPGTAAELSLGAVAGAIAQIFTIPVSVVTTRQQTQPKSEKKGLIDTAREVIHGEDGIYGLWRGLKASLVLVVNPAITYGAYQRLRIVLFPGKVNLRPWEAFRKSTFPPSTDPLYIPSTVH